MLNVDFLVIAPSFHKYGCDISKALTKFGKTNVLVQWPEGGQLSVLGILSSFIQIVFAGFVFISVSIGLIKPVEILVVKGDFLKNKTLLRLKKKTKKMCLWLMDPVARLREELSTDLYDRVFSFDLADVKQLGFLYVPLFSSFLNSDGRQTMSRDQKFKQSSRRGLPGEVPQRLIRRILFVGSIYGERLDDLILLSRQVGNSQICVWGGFGPLKLWQFFRLKRKLIGFKNIYVRYGVLSKARLDELLTSGHFDLVFNSIPTDQRGLNMRFFESNSRGISQVTKRGDSLVSVLREHCGRLGQAEDLNASFLSDDFLTFAPRKDLDRSAADALKQALGL